mmetsp:Transcript_22371/g.63632  ORF Transcript_22371/g.63632 Transcript_22371/m.63632 type:complete len:249 (+) Transcript_22371:2090-2836(+)
MPLAPKQVVVAAFFQHALARTHHDNFVGATDCGQSMGDHNGRALLRLDQFVQGFLHHALALVVQSRGGLIKDENGGVADDGPSNRDTLLLPAGERRAALAAKRVDSFRKLAHKVVGIGVLESLDDHVLRRSHSVSDAICHVGCNGVGEQEGHLRDKGNLPSEPSQVDILEVHPVDCDRPGVRVVEALHKLRDSALPTARATNEGDRSPGVDRQADLVEYLDLAPRRVAEGDVVEANLTLEALKLAAFV